MKKFLFLMLFISLFGLVSASFNLADVPYSIEKTYGAGENVRGWIELKLQDENSDSLFTTSTGNSFTLVEVLNKSPTAQFTCNPVNCKKDYVLSNKNLVQTFTINSGESKIFGINLTGNISGISFVNFSISSSALSDCKNQIAIDFFDDGQNEITNTKSSNEICAGTKDYGCFSLTIPSVQSNLGATPYCQKVKLEPAPAHEIGARLKRLGSTKQISLKFYNLSGVERATCDLAEVVSPTDGEESCVVDYPLDKEETGYVCIYSPDGDTQYSIKGYQATNGCGFREIPNGHNSEVAAYSIFAQSRKYAALGTIILPDEWNIGQHYIDFIKSKYKNTDCTNGCTIPIKIYSNQNQQVTIKELKLDYETVLFGPQTENSLFTVAESKIKISTSDFQKIYLDNVGFKAPNSVGQQNFKLLFNSQEVISETIEIKEVPTPVEVQPIITAAALPTDFYVFVASNENITSYDWEFGDGKKENTTTPKVQHTYLQIGTFDLKVSITGSNGLKGVNTFKISVESPYEAVNQTIKEKLDRIKNVKNQIAQSFTGFEQTQINNYLNLANVESSIGTIQSKYITSNPTDNQTSVKLMEELVKLKIPSQIIITKKANTIPFYSPKGSVDYAVFKRVDNSGLEYDSNKFEGLVNGWNKQNMDTKLTFKEISGKYDGEIKPITRLFELDMTKKKTFSYTPILFLPKLYEMKFSTDVQIDNSSDYVIIPLEENNQKIIFATIDDVDFTNLEAFISPSLDNLGIQKPVEEKNNLWIWIVIIFLALIVVGIFVYVILQKWYAKKYESHLFKHINELYNMETFIQNAKKNGKDEKEIASKLKQSGWNSEQVKYAMKKYMNKNTGMPFTSDKPKK